MERGTRWAVGVAVLASLVLAAPGAAAGDGEVDPAEDNPPGCVTSTGEDVPQCGAQGRDHFASAEHVPPIEACADVRSPAGSVVTRILPDGPRHPDGTMAFIPGACVYLPPGYATSGLRYPVVYLLHGGGGDQANWVTNGGVQAVLDEKHAEDPSQAVIAVMPDGRNGQWFDYLDGSFLIRTYVLDHLIPYVDGHFRTIADRRGRAIAGLSNGGYGALHFAAKAPDLFVAAGSMSGNIEAYGFAGMGRPVVEGAPTVPQTTGPPTVNGAYFYGNHPVEMVPNLDHVDLAIDWGSLCIGDAAVDGCATWAFEQTFRYPNQHFRDRLEEDGYAGTYEYRETEGAHAWRWWTPWLRDRHLPFFYDRLADPAPARDRQVPSPVPESFRYRSVDATFDVWGYEVVSDRDVTEMLELDDVTADGFTVQGSGTAVVTTPPRYRPRREYTVAVSDQLERRVRADRDGRLRVEVDLGPSHTTEQFTAAGTAPPEMTLAGDDYWVRRTVTIR